MSQKIGPREQKLREMRAERRAGTVSPETLRHTKSLLASVNLDAQAAKRAPRAPRTRGERPVAKKTKTKSKKKPKRGASKKRVIRADKLDRSPLAVGTFIVLGGENGRSMADLEKHFGIEAHPMRSKIHAARHEHGFTIDYDAKAKAYVGVAPKVKEPAQSNPEGEAAET